jgi:hypothetical protein
MMDHIELQSELAIDLEVFIIYRGVPTTGRGSLIDI